MSSARILARTLPLWLRAGRRRILPASRWTHSQLLSCPFTIRTSTTSTNDAESDPLDQPAWVTDPELDPYILALGDATPMIAGGMPFGIHFLGTGAGCSTLKRNSSATALSLGRNVYLFDAGEAVQRQFMVNPRIRMGDVSKIFITHLHGDHIFGLPGLLLFLQNLEKHRTGQLKDSPKNRKNRAAALNEEEPRRVEIYGPVGLYNYIAMTISLSCTELNRLIVDVYELTGGSRRWVHPGSLGSYPEFRNRGLRRHSIPQNKDGTWTIQTPVEITTPELARQYNSAPTGHYVKAAQVMHVKKLQCFGFTVQEPFTQPRKIDADKARALGLEGGKPYAQLKSGFAVTSDDGSRLVQPEEVLRTDEPPLVPRKLAVLGDCCAVPGPMSDLCRDADVLIHEATFLEADRGNKVVRGGHSTAAMAAEVACRVGAKTLLLNHISPAHKGIESEGMLLAEAKKVASQHGVRVQVAYDFLDFIIPRHGFPWQVGLENPPVLEDVETEKVEAS